MNKRNQGDDPGSTSGIISLKDAEMLSSHILYKGSETLATLLDSYLKELW